MLRDRKRQRRLGSVLLQQHLGLLAMLLLTAIVGGSWIHTWQRASHESLHINAMMRDAQHLYRDIYRQAQEAIIASQTTDGLSVTQYWEHVYDMDARFERLEQQLQQIGEKNALAGMRHAYGMMQTQVNVLLSQRQQEDPHRLIDAAVERWITGAFADAYSSLTRVLDRHNTVVSQRLMQWNRWAFWIFPLPLLASILLVLLAHRRLKRVFSLPMQSLSKGAVEISHGNLNHRVPETGVRETRALASSVNQMAADLARAREQLLERERRASLERLVPMVAHNIRNPLASIRALAQAAHPDDDLDEREETRQAIIATVDRLERWTASLLDYLYPFTPNVSQIDVRSLIDGLTNMAQPQAQMRKISMRVQVPPGLTLSADRELLEQALHGLLINAIEASPSDAAVQIHAADSTQTVDIHIDDHGPGMLFQPDTATPSGPGPTTKTHGTGLGIPFALRVCQVHGGRLLFGKAPAGGTRVSIQLPKNDPAGNPK